MSFRITPVRSTVRGFEGLAIIDCDVHPLSDEQLPRFLSQRSRRYLELVGVRRLPAEAVLRTGMRPDASRLDTVPPSGGRPGSDPEFARAQLLDEYGITAAVLNNIRLGSTGIPLDLARDMVRGANDHMETWLDSDRRWLGSITALQRDPAWTVAEIVRCREKTERYVQVLMDAHGERPAGNPMYWPIYEVACDLDIPVAFHITGRSRDHLSTGVGGTTYYYEQRTALDILGQPLVCSMIFEGVFDRWPNLRIALVEMDWTWAVPLAWRLDASWQVLREEAADLQRLPSEYFRDHFWFSTQPGLETERPSQALEAYDQLEKAGFGERLMFASDYPHWDMDSPFEAIPRRLSRAMKERVLGENGAALYSLRLDNPVV